MLPCKAMIRYQNNSNFTPIDLHALSYKAAKIIIRFCDNLCRHFLKKSNLVKGRSEAQFKYVQQGEDEVSQDLWDRFLASCTKIPVQDNVYLRWWLRGLSGFDPEMNPNMAPPFLSKEGFTKLKVGQLLNLLALSPRPIPRVQAWWGICNLLLHKIMNILYY